MDPSKIIHQPYDLSITLGELWSWTTHQPIGPRMEMILQFIEPKIVRGSYLPCWRWGGKHQYFNKNKANEYSYPVIGIPIDPIRPKNGRKVEYVHRYMAATFFHMKPKEIVFRTCFHSDCVNPQHFAISYRNDPDFM